MGTSNIDVDAGNLAYGVEKEVVARNFVNSSCLARCSSVDGCKTDYMEMGRD